MSKDSMEFMEKHSWFLIGIVLIAVVISTAQIYWRTMVLKDFHTIPHSQEKKNNVTT